MTGCHGLLSVGHAMPITGCLPGSEVVYKVVAVHDPMFKLQVKRVKLVEILAFRK